MGYKVEIGDVVNYVSDKGNTYVAFVTQVLRESTVHLTVFPPGRGPLWRMEVPLGGQDERRVWYPRESASAVGDLGGAGLPDDMAPGNVEPEPVSPAQLNMNELLARLQALVNKVQA